MPFVTAGDPDLELHRGGARAGRSGRGPLCELGIPYSDPIADGPVIQASYTRALGGGDQAGRDLRTVARLTPAACRSDRDDGQLLDRLPPRARALRRRCRGSGRWPGRSCPTCRSRSRTTLTRPAGRPVWPDPTGHAHHAAGTGGGDRGEVDRLHLLRLGGRHHRCPNGSFRRAIDNVAWLRERRPTCRSASALVSPAGAGEGGLRRG